MKNTLFLIIVLIWSFRVNAQSPDSTIKHSPLKAMGDKQYNALLNGEDLYDMPAVAEVNHYPAPWTALKYKKQADLSPIQIDKILVIDKELHRKRLEMGRIIIRNEKTLDSLFKYNRLDNGSLIFYANRYGLFQGEMRNAILQACYATRLLLSEQQVKMLEKLQKANR